MKPEPERGKIEPFSANCNFFYDEPPTHGFSVRNVDGSKTFFEYVNKDFI